MRKGSAKRRYISPDPTYNDPLVTRFVNALMKKGKKNLAYSIFYGAIDIVSEKSDEPGIEVWKKALNNVMPSVEVKRRRAGGISIQVPIEVRPERKITLGTKWIIAYAKARGEKTMKEKLAHELIAASKEEGGAIKRRNDTYKMAMANKAFSHLKF